MVESLLLALGVASGFIGMGWLALSMSQHWQQVQDTSLPPAKLLRALAAVALLTSLFLCLWVDHPSIAVLVWVMVISASAFLVAMLLAWRPRWLKPLVSWAH